MEVWKAIPDTNETYFISNYGRVKSVTRYVPDKNGRVVHYYGKILEQRDNSRGYPRVMIRTSQGKGYVFVHRLVALAFVENPHGKDVVNHIDCDPHNNNADNLEWVTQLENMQYASRLGRMKYTDRHKKNLRASLIKNMGKPVVAVPTDGGDIIWFSSVNATAEHGFQPSCVSNCCNGIRDSHKGYYWRFADEKQKNESS